MHQDSVGVAAEYSWPRPICRPFVGRFWHRDKVPQRTALGRVDGRISHRHSVFRQKAFKVAKLAVILVDVANEHVLGLLSHLFSPTVE